MTRLVPEEGIAWVEDQGVVYIAPLPSGPIVVLEGTAALIWRAVVGGDRESAVERVGVEVGLAASDLQDDVAAFIDALVDRGLVRVDPDGSA